LNAGFRRGGRSTIIMALTALSRYLQVKKSSVLPFLLFVSCALILAARFSCAQVTVDGTFEIEDNSQVDYREASSRRVIAQTAVSFLALCKTTCGITEEKESSLLFVSALAPVIFPCETRLWRFSLIKLTRGNVYCVPDSLNPACVTRLECPESNPWVS
jgi:hypothetical protein